MKESIHAPPDPALSLPPSELHRRLCHYISQHEVHERLAELTWGDALSRDRAERLGLTRSLGVYKCRHFTADRGRDLRCEQREEYLDERPKFIQTAARLRHWPWEGIDESLLGPVDVYLNGGWRYAYWRYWAHFERSRQSTGMGWTRSVLVKEQRPAEKVRVEEASTSRSA